MTTAPERETRPDEFERGWLAGLADALNICADSDTVEQVRNRLLDLVVEAQAQQHARGRYLSGRPHGPMLPRRRRR